MRKIIIITGAGSGLGKEFAVQLASLFNSQKENLELWLIARTEENLKKTSELVQKTLSNENSSFIKIRIFLIDLGGVHGVNAFKKLVQDENELSQINIQILVNNAGFGTYGSFCETPIDEELKMIDLNCTSLTGLCSCALNYMDKGSLIINVSSLAAFMPLGNFAVYAATKAFVLSFSVALCAEVKDRGIKVCALCPGSVSTNFSNVASNGARKEVLHGKSPQKVVRHCIKNALKGKKIILWSPKWKFTAFMSRFVGRFLVARYTFLFNKRPRKN